MAIKILSIGDTTYGYLKEGESEYLKRLKRYAPIEYVEIRGVKKIQDPDRIRIAEEEKFLKHIRSSDQVVLLDEKGKQFSSEKLAVQLEKWMSLSPNLVFIVGGAYGFSRGMYDRANAKLSLSDLTFSHQMVRLFFFEQLYRCFTILNGEPYHNA